MSNAIVPFSEMQQLAKSIAASKLFGIKTPEEALSLMAIAQAEGLHPAIAARDYHIIQGRPTLKADAMLARFQASGGKVEWHTYTDDQCDATLSHPQGGTVRVMWDMARVKKADIKNSAMYSKYPRNMLRARVISEGIRTIYPGVCVGVYTPEEVDAFEPQKPTPISSTPIIEQPPKQQAPIHPETGEVSPHQIPVPMLADNSGTDWMKWGISYSTALQSSSTMAELNAWVTSNAAAMGKAFDEAAKIHARLTAIIDARRLALVPKKQQPPKDELEEALTIPQFLQRQVPEAAE